MKPTTSVIPPKYSELRHRIEINPRCKILFDENICKPTLSSETLVLPKNTSNTLGNVFSIAYFIEYLELKKASLPEKISRIIAREFSFQLLRDKECQDTLREFTNHLVFSCQKERDSIERILFANGSDRESGIIQDLCAYEGIEAKALEIRKNNLLQAIKLARSTESTLMSNSDGRSAYREDGRNKYGGLSRPNDEIYELSSCSISSPSQEAFSKADSMRISLIKSAIGGNFERTYERISDNLKEEIFKFFGLSRSDAELLFVPSGTDAEMIPATLVKMIAKHDRIINIITASGEVGSGTAEAAKLHFFGNIAPFSKTVKAGEPIDDFAKMIDVIKIPARDENGSVLSDEYIRKEIRKQLSIENKSLIIHQVQCSKSGIITPSTHILEELKKLNKDIFFVADLAQMRCSQKELKNYIADNHFVIISGSKFFGSAPFSGGIIIPKKFLVQAKRAKKTLLPDLSTFFSQHELKSLYKLQQIGNKATNVGLLLRWQTAMTEMQYFFSNKTKNLDKIVLKHINKIQKYIEADDYLLKIENAREGSKTFLPKTIITFSIKGKGRLLTKDELSKVHEFMRSDLRKVIKKGIAKDERTLAKEKFLLGQPITIKPGQGALRIALSARRCIDLAKSNSPDRTSTAKEIRALQKVSLIAKHIDKFL